MAWIYRIVRIGTGNCYVGHTSKMSVEKRWAQHLALLTAGKHHSRYLQNAWKKYGADAFQFQVIEECAEADKIKREQHWIDGLKSCFNLGKIAGSRKGVRFTKIQRELLSKLRTGKKLSAETRAKIAAKAMGNQRTKGLKWSDEARANWGKASRGKPRTPAQIEATRRSLELARQKTRANKPGWIPTHRIGVKDSVETIEKRRQSRLKTESMRTMARFWITDGVVEQQIEASVPVPEGWRRGRQPKIGEISRSRVGEKRSDEARAKMSEAHKHKPSSCADCGVDTAPPIGRGKHRQVGRWEHYMVHDQIWKDFGVGDGFLCIGCLEKRLGRTLTPQDFLALPANSPHPYDTPRLRDRKGQ